MRTLLDTHAWIWWVTEDRRLSRRARIAIAAALRDHDLWLSLMSVWELAKKVEKGQLVLNRPVARWLDEALTIEGLETWELTRQILVESCSLPDPFHGNQADHIIVATARLSGATIVTKDDRIRRYPHVQSVW